MKKAKEGLKHGAVAVASAAAGSALGKFSLIAAIGAFAYGAMKDEPLAYTSGAGMLAGVALAGAADKPVTDGSYKAEAMENAKAFGRGLAMGAFIDKVSPAAAEKLGIGQGSVNTANGLGSLYGSWATGYNNSPYMARTSEAADEYLERLNAAAPSMGALPEYNTLAGMMPDPAFVA